jgi:hypothetical protein
LQASGTPVLKKANDAGPERRAGWRRLDQSGEAAGAYTNPAALVGGFILLVVVAVEVLVLLSSSLLLLQIEAHMHHTYIHTGPNMI